MSWGVKNTVNRNVTDREAPGTDAAHCRAIVAAHARTFSMASRLLPSRKRRAMFAIYAVCRTADDIVDLAAPDPAGSARGKLASFRSDVDAAVDGEAGTPILRELAWAIRSFGIPVRALRELLDAVARDIDPPRLASWADLNSYCEGVAGSVGEMSAAVFGVQPSADREAVIAQARRLGVAMQLTNILRDVGEDAARGRCYLPSDELAIHGIGTGEVLDRDLAARWPAWRQFMAFQVRRARDMYRQSITGIAGLDDDAQRCALACAAGYAEILRAIERRDYDTLSGRAAASRLDHLRVAWQSFRLTPPTFTAVGPRATARPVAS